MNTSVITKSQANPNEARIAIFISKINLRKGDIRRA